MRFPWLGDLISLVSDFLLFHELGHIYCDHTQPNHLSIKYITPNTYRQGDWQICETPLYDGCTLFNYEIDGDGSQLGSILMSADHAGWRDEFACDVFAMYGLLYASSGERIKTRDISYVCDAMSIWQCIFWILGWKQAMRLRPRDDGQVPRLSHPPSKLRFDFLIFHAFKLAIEHLPQEANIPLGSVLERASILWGETMNKAMTDGIEYSFYGFDEDSDRVNVGKIQSFAVGGHIAYHPSAFEQIRRLIMPEFLPRALRDGWDAASKVVQPEFRRFINTYQLSGRPVVRELGEHLHAVGMRLVSEDRP